MVDMQKFGNSGQGLYMKISKYYRAFLRKKLNIQNQNRLTNKDFSILCNNCVGGGHTSRIGGKI